MSNSRYSTARDKTGRIPIPDSASKPFSRVHSRNRNRNSEDSADEKRQAGLDRRPSDDDRQHARVSEQSKQVNAKGSVPGRRSSSSSDNDDRSTRTRARSPIECQCSCHTEGGRRRSPSRDARRGRSTSADRRSSLDSINGRFGKGAFSEGADSRDNSGKSTDYGRNRNGYRSGGSDNDEDHDGNRHNRMPPINITDSETKKKGKGGFTTNSRNRSSFYKPRVDSKTSHLSVTSVNSKGSKNKEPFRYYGRSRSAGSISSFGGVPSQYDYAHEDFLTGRFTSEYQARYEMRMGQRYKVHPDKSIHYIDPAGQHILVPKGEGKALMPRRNSDSDIAKNNKNVRLEPLNAPKESTDPKKWAGNSTHVDRGRPGPESRVVAPTGGGPPKRPSVHSLPPMERTPSLPQGAAKATSAREETVHPLGLSSSPKRRTQLQPM